MKHENVCRIGLLNPLGFTVQVNSAKDDQLREFMREAEIDIMNFLEVNVCWHKVSPRNRLDEHMMGWFETLHKSAAYNVREGSPCRQQFRGNVILSINNVAHQVLKSGRDETGLGQWVWTQYQGQNGIITRVVCAY
jgi:hypothetical protein